MEPNTNPSNEQQAPVVNNQPQTAPSASNDTVLAAVSTIPLVGLILYFAMPNVSSFVRHYEKQGTMLFAAYIAAYIITWFLGYIPFLGGLLDLVIYIGLFVAWILLLVNALQNKTYRLPVLSDLADQYLK